jgi:hypothetical protein
MRWTTFKRWFQFYLRRHIKAFGVLRALKALGALRSKTMTSSLNRRGDVALRPRTKRPATPTTPTATWMQRHLRAGIGQAVPVNPIKPTFKAPGTKRFKVEDDKLLSNFAFNFNMRRST